MFIKTVPDRDIIARQTAEMLLSIGAVNFRADPPYRLTSGRVSPVYIDCRRIISFPQAREMCMDFAVSMLLRDVGPDAFDAVAGGETAGIPFAAWIAQKLSLPMLYVRKQPKGFGRDARIEGAMADGARVLLVEDLATDGGSKVGFADALRAAGGQVAETVVVFYYDIFPGSRERLAEHGLRLHSLATWHDVLPIARSRGLFDDASLDAVAAFLDDPLGWSASRDGA
jgi:orotate phosphoribosyltransferase